MIPQSADAALTENPAKVREGMADDGSYRPRAREEGLHIQTVGDELLVFDSYDDRAHSLNDTAARVWGAEVISMVR